jgi:predicted HTH transcriptional regulator
VEKVHHRAWVQKALGLLDHSLTSPTHEMNELDWKLALSDDKARLSEHLSAFSNFSGGGFLAYGIEPTGSLAGVDAQQIDGICNTLSNIGRHALEPPITLDHAIQEYKGTPILFIFIPESSVKPVHLRNKDLLASYIRSGGTTRKASRNEVGSMLAERR